MKTTNTELLASFGSLKREVAGGARIYTGSTVSKTLLPTETLASITIENSVPNGKFFGFATSQKLTIKAIEKLPLEKGTKIQPYITTKDIANAAELPFFYVETVEIDDVNNTTTITAYDCIHSASKKVLGDLTITYPITLLGLATQIATELGCTLEANFADVNISLQKDSTNVDGSETLQAILTSIAEATGTICFCQSGSKLTFKNLSKTPAHTIDKSTYFNFSSQAPVTLTGVASATQLGENYVSGTEGLVQTVWDNPFFELREDIATVVDALAAKVKGLVFTPYELESRGNAYYEIGDCLAVETTEGTQVIYYFNESLSYTGGLKSKTSWVATEEEKVEAAPTNLGDSLKQTSAKVDKVNKRIDLVVSDIGENSSKIAQLELTTDGIATSVSDVRTEVNTKTSELDGKINSTASTLRGEIDSTEQALQKDIDDTEAALQKDIDDTAAELTTQLTTTKTDLQSQITQNANNITLKTSEVQTTLEQSIANTKTELQGEIDSTETALQDQITAQGSTIETVKQNVSDLSVTTSGISASVSSMEKTITDAVDGVNKDIQSLSEEVALAVSAEDVKIQISTALENGTSKVVTNTGFTFDDTGLTVSKTGSEMTTQITEDGMKVHRDNTEVLTANNEGVIAYNLHAKTFLIVGGRSRFENYVDSNGEERTGCFWIGN